MNAIQMLRDRVDLMKRMHCGLEYSQGVYMNNTSFTKEASSELIRAATAIVKMVEAQPASGVPLEITYLLKALDDMSRAQCAFFEAETMGKISWERASLLPGVANPDSTWE